MGTMTDEAKALVERLREDGYSGHNPLCLEAADRIEALEAEVERLNAILSAMNDTDVIARTMAENERLREALQGISEFGARHTGHGYSCHLLARAALAGDSHDQ